MDVYLQSNTYNAVYFVLNVLTLHSTAVLCKHFRALCKNRILK